MTRHENPLRRRVVVLLTLVCFMAACHHWVALEPPIAETLAAHHGKVRLTLENGQRVAFDSVWVAQDSVFWFVYGDTTSVPMAAVAEVEQEKTDVGATVGLAVLGAAAAFGIFVFVALCCIRI